jgi:hypothetical protein
MHNTHLLDRPVLIGTGQQSGRQIDQKPTSPGYFDRQRHYKFKPVRLPFVDYSAMQVSAFAKKNCGPEPARANFAVPPGLSASPGWRTPQLDDETRRWNMRCTCAVFQRAALCRATPSQLKRCRTSTTMFSADLLADFHNAGAGQTDGRCQ